MPDLIVIEGRAYPRNGDRVPLAAYLDAMTSDASDQFRYRTLLKLPDPIVLTTLVIPDDGVLLKREVARLRSIALAFRTRTPVTLWASETVDVP